MAHFLIVLFIAFLNYILNYMHSAHTRAPRLALHDFMTRVIKKISKNKNNLDNHI